MILRNLLTIYLYSANMKLTSHEACFILFGGV